MLHFGVLASFSSKVENDSKIVDCESKLGKIIICVFVSFRTTIKGAIAADRVLDFFNIQ